EGMCWEQSPQKRTIATSRSEATTTEPEPQNETVVRTQESPPPTNPGKPDIRPALPLRSHPQGNRFHLTSSFRNGHSDLRTPGGAVGGNGGRRDSSKNRTVLACDRQSRERLRQLNMRFSRRREAKRRWSRRTVRRNRLPGV